MEQRERSLYANGSILLEDLITSSNGKCNPIRHFSADELMKATDNFDPRHIIENCPLPKEYGIKVDELDDLKVSYVMYRGSLADRPVIIKKFLRLVREDEVRSRAIRDIVITTQMSSHKNVLKLLGCCLEFPVPILVHEFAKNGVLNDQGGFGADEILPWKTRLRIAKELANAITYLHSALCRPVIHRDIRPSCIFLDHDLVPKFCNFSLSMTISKKSHATEDFKGTFGYSDPAYLVSDSFSEKSDVYSFGVLLFVLLTGQKAINVPKAPTYPSLVQYVKDCVGNDRLADIVDPKICREGGGEEDGRQARQVKAFLALALACTQEKGEERPYMIDVAKELTRIQKSI